MCVMHHGIEALHCEQSSKQLRWQEKFWGKKSLLNGYVLHLKVFKKS